MNNCKAIITDLDGTILPLGGQISAETLGTLKLLGTKGILRIIATGRTLFAARKFLPDNFPIDYLVFSSGAGIMRWKDKKIIYTRQLSLAETRHIADYLWNYNVNFTIQREIPDNHHFYYTDIYPAHSDYLRRLEKFREFGTLISSSEDISSASTQFVMILDALRLKWIDTIRKDLHRFSVIRSTSPLDQQAIWLEIYPSGVNKGTTCQFLLESLQLTNEDCAGIGNDYNDIDFLNMCGAPFVVDNAPERMKSAYNTVASDIENGFCKFISTVLP